MNHKPLFAVILASILVLSFGNGNTYSSSKSIIKSDSLYDVTLKRPSDYKGDWWVTEHIPTAKYFYYSMISLSQKYPDGFYAGDDFKLSHDIYYIRYIFMDYEDNFLVHSMRITNPDVTIYGLNIYSSREEIKATMDGIPGFETYPLEFKPSLKIIATYKDKIDFCSSKMRYASRCNYQRRIDAMKKKNILMFFFLLLASCNNEGDNTSVSYDTPSSNPSPYQIPFQPNQQVSVNDMENYSWKGNNLLSVTYVDNQNEIEYRVAPYPTYKSKECIVQFTIYNQNIDILGMPISHFLYHHGQ